MLLLDDDDELPAFPAEDETSLTAQFGIDGLRAIDRTIRGHARPHWLKVARVVHDAIKTANFPIGDAIVDLHVRRVIDMVQSNVLEAQGNLRKPRWSEIRLAPRPPAE